MRMKQVLSFLAAAIALSAAAMPAQNLAGNWQGTLGAPPNALRLLLRVAPGDNGRLSASLVSLDQGGFDNPIPVDSVVRRDSTLVFFISEVNGTYRGTLTSHGSVIRGEWIQGAPAPLDFVRPTERTAWRDASPHRQRFVNVEKNVRLEVLDWGGTGRPIVFLAGAGNSAHIFDDFAPKFANEYHVYGITQIGRAHV